MTLEEFANAMENDEELIIKYKDEKLGRMVNVADDQRDQFIRNHGNLEVTRIAAGSFRVIVTIYNPFCN